MKSLAGKAFSAILLLSISACATGREPAVRTVEVRVPVHEPCPIAEPAAPDYADDDADLKAAPNLFERVKLLAAGRLQRIAHQSELEAWGRACAG